MTPEREKEFREHWSHQYDELLAEIDYLRDSFLDMEVVRKHTYDQLLKTEEERDQFREKLEIAEYRLAVAESVLHRLENPKGP